MFHTSPRLTHSHHPIENHHMRRHPQDLPCSVLLFRMALRLAVSRVPSGIGSPESSESSEGKVGTGGVLMGSTFASLG